MIIFLGGLAAILVATLTPFNFIFHNVSLQDYLTRFSVWPSSNLDFPNNILLFVPFGFGFGIVARRYHSSRRSLMFSALLASFMVTVSVESLQQFLPSRTPDLCDIIANTLGGILGVRLMFVWLDRPPFDRTVYGLLAKRITLVATFYFSLLLYFSNFRH